MAQLQWQASDGSVFQQGQQSALEASKNTSSAVDTSYLADIINSGSSNVSPQDFYSKDIARRSMLAQESIWNRYNQLQNQREQDLQNSYGRFNQLLNKYTNTPSTSNIPDKQHELFEITSDNTLARDIRDSFTSHGLNPAMGYAIAHIESGFGNNRQRVNSNGNKSAFTGAFQINNSYLKNGYNATDREQADWTAQNILSSKKRYERKYGSGFNTGIAYLYHQQGANGAEALLSNKGSNVLDVYKKIFPKTSEKVLKQRILQNGGKLDMTAGEFANLWVNKGNSLEQAYQDKYFKDTLQQAGINLIRR